MSYTVEQLDSVLKTFFSDFYLNSAGRPSACSHAAEVCFIEPRPESKETQILREALRDLHNDGSFKFKGN